MPVLSPLDVLGLRHGQTHLLGFLSRKYSCCTVKHQNGGACGLGCEMCTNSLEELATSLLTKCWSPSTKINDVTSHTTVTLIPTAMWTSISHNVILTLLKTLIHSHGGNWIHNDEFSRPSPQLKAYLWFHFLFSNLLVFYKEFLCKSVTPAALYL
jgi:Fe-S cluster biogenesis protein NfuA